MYYGDDDRDGLAQATYEAEQGNTSILQSMVQKGVAGATDALNQVLSGVNPNVKTEVTIDPNTLQQVKSIGLWLVGAAVILLFAFKKIL